MTARVVVLAAAVAAALTACGIQPDVTAREIKPPPGPYHVSAAPAAPTRPGNAVETLFLVKDTMLVRVTRPVPQAPTVDALMQELLAGPTETERNQGLSSALPGASVIGQVHLTNGLATVELASALDGTGRSDETLAIAQVVCTLAERSDVTGVVFVRSGSRVGVPRGDGSQSQDPLSTSDYAELIAVD